VWAPERQDGPVSIHLDVMECQRNMHLVKCIWPVPALWSRLHLFSCIAVPCRSFSIANVIVLNVEC